MPRGLGCGYVPKHQDPAPAVRRGRHRPGHAGRRAPVRAEDQRLPEPGRPFTHRFAGDFCPIDPELLKRPLVHRFFVRISVLWATVLLLNAGFVLWLLLTSSLHAFVLERAAVTYSLTAFAIYLSIRQFVVMMRGDGITVQWGA